MQIPRQKHTTVCQAPFTVYGVIKLIMMTCFSLEQTGRSLQAVSPSVAASQPTPSGGMCVRTPSDSLSQNRCFYQYS